MQSSVPSSKSASEPAHRWGEIWGTLIAVATLVLPVTAIVHYSTSTAQANPAPTNSVLDDR